MNIEYPYPMNDFRHFYNKYEVKHITDICEMELIDITFKKCVKGYHLINSSSINETIWEDINAIIFNSLGISNISF